MYQPPPPPPAQKQSTTASPSAGQPGSVLPGTAESPLRVPDDQLLAEQQAREIIADPRGP